MVQPEELARRRLINFTGATFHQYIAEEAHSLIAHTLDQMVRGHIKRLMIVAPPQHGKSELTSVRLPAFWLGKRPNDPVILASYAASLAEKHSREARQVIEGVEYQMIFPGVSTRRDSRAVDRWQLAPPYRGSMMAVGVGGPVTGHGALLGIIDDPFENWRQAQSLTIRDHVWDWWRATFRTRIWEGGAIVLIMTRWHEDDLAGRLLQTQGDLWTVLRLPAIAETQEERDNNDRFLGLPVGQRDPLWRTPGLPLCPKRFSRAALDGLKRDVGEIAWTTEYQGVPRAPEGNRFKRSWFKIVETVPRKARRVRYWDKAGTADGGAYTAGVLVARTDEGLVYIEDVVRGQWSAYEREQIMKQIAQLDGLKYKGEVHIWIEQEPGSGGKESAESTIRNLSGHPVYADRPTGDKDVRLEPFAAQAEADNVKLVRGDWNGGWIEELCAIPNGTYRDQADATAGGFNKLNEAGTTVSTMRTVNLYRSKRR